ncbi:hypothetical protein [Bradyrhizobium sp. LA7.1]|uniref:hypothetical protein n=1 Tax=Bradyrhizobium sp. LA7.1 TaxID=3156324 RepID=UPI00339094DB
MSMQKPPFRPERGATPRERARWARWMRDYLEEQVDQQHIEEVASASNLDEKVWGIACARAGDPRFLQQLYPEFADCILPPKRRRGEKRFMQKSVSVAERAASIARRIKIILERDHGRKRRRTGEPSAEDFAVEICRDWCSAPQLAVDDVLAAAKRISKRKGPAKHSNSLQIVDLPG